MKVFAKLVATVAAILICLGLVVGVVALVMGATWDGLSLSFWPSQPDMSAEYTDVTSLDFELGMAEVVIEYGDTFSIDAKNLYTKLTSSVSDGTWKIRTEELRLKRFFGTGPRKARITITLPSGFVADEMELQLGMGSLKSPSLSGDRISVEAGMGSMVIKGLAAQKVSIKTGMGSVDVSDAQVERLEADCGMGAIAIRIDGKQADYGYRAEVGMGSIVVGANRHAGIGGEQSYNTGAENFLDLNCGMGSIDVSFSE